MRISYFIQIKEVAFKEVRLALCDASPFFFFGLLQKFHSSGGQKETRLVLFVSLFVLRVYYTMVPNIVEALESVTTYE